MITIHGPTATEGTWNVIGIKDNGLFNLQGNITTEEVRELKEECERVLKAVKERR